jgi:uncharacterized protein YfiM (DUF2279 family)
MALALLLAVLLPGRPEASTRACSDRWLGRDKAAHFALSLALTGYSHHLLRYEQQKSGSYSRNASMVITLGWGISKEARDGHSPGNHFCFKDLAADLAGLGAGLLMFTIK